MEGTATYLPPENLQCMRSKEKSLRITELKDSWALGTVFFRVWCFGTRPYNADNMQYEELLSKLPATVATATVADATTDGSAGLLGLSCKVILPVFAEKIADVRLEDLDFSHCSPDTPLAVLVCCCCLLLL